MTKSMRHALDAHDGEPLRAVREAIFFQDEDAEKQLLGGSVFSSETVAEIGIGQCFTAAGTAAQPFSGKKVAAAEFSRTENLNFRAKRRRIVPNVIYALNEQFGKEMYSANLYLAMSAFLQNAGLPGFANWMRVQYQEETEHALKFHDFVLSRGGAAKIPAVAEPPASWNGALGVFEAAAAHEAEVTRSINELVALAKNERDYATEIFLQWFVTEQIEEEENVKNIVDRLKLVNGEGQGLLMLDAEAAARVYAGARAANVQQLLGTFSGF